MLSAKNIEMVMIMHKSLLFFIFIFASWTDPPQFLGQASQGDEHNSSDTITSNPSHHIQSTLPVPLRHHHHSFLYIPDTCSRPHLVLLLPDHEQCVIGGRPEIAQQAQYVECPPQREENRCGTIQQSWHLPSTPSPTWSNVYPGGLLECERSFPCRECVVSLTNCRSTSQDCYVLSSTTSPCLLHIFLSSSRQKIKITTEAIV